jgi:hypothetical protein
LPDGRECLVQWRPTPNKAVWQLNLTERSADVDAPSDRVQVFRATLDLPFKRTTLAWDFADAAFQAWVTANLAAIAADTLVMQDRLRPAILARARTGRPRNGLREFLPHLAILVALAGFAYMFAVVHLKP